MYPIHFESNLQAMLADCAKSQHTRCLKKQNGAKEQAWDVQWITLAYSPILSTSDFIYHIQGIKIQRQ